MIQAFGAYLLWAIFPLYFPLLEPAAPLEILAHRFIWTFALMAVVLLVTKKWRELRAASARTWGITVAAAAFIAVNWGVYVFLVNTGRVAEAALGYFINPLVSVLLAVIFLKESLSRLQLASIAVAFIAVIVLTIGVGYPPVWGLALAFSFGFYGLLKKQVSLSAGASLTAESAVVMPVAIGYLVWLGNQGVGTFITEGTSHTLLLMSSGVITAVPLLLFGIGAKKIPLATIGLMQYLTPAVQMALAVFVFKEHLSTERWIGFIIIWIAVAIFMVDIVKRMRARRRTRRNAKRAVTTPESTVAPEH